MTRGSTFFLLKERYSFKLSNYLKLRTYSKGRTMLLMFSKALAIMNKVTINLNTHLLIKNYCRRVILNTWKAMSKQLSTYLRSQHLKSKQKQPKTSSDSTKTTSPHGHSTIEAQFHPEPPHPGKQVPKSNSHDVPSDNLHHFAGNQWLWRIKQTETQKTIPLKTPVHVSTHGKNTQIKKSSQTGSSFTSLLVRLIKLILMLYNFIISHINPKFQKNWRTVYSMYFIEGN